MPVSKRNTYKYKIVAETMINLVPNWYDAESGPFQDAISIGGLDYEFCCQHAASKELQWFLDTINSELTELCNEASDVRHPLFLEMIQEQFATKWLEHHAPNVRWAELIKYMHDLSHRTYENHPATLNMVIGDQISKTGRQLGSVRRSQKFFDQLATSNFTYLKVDRNIKLVGLEEVAWDVVVNPTKYKLLPEFLYPLHCNMKSTDFSAHLTSAGDWIFMDSLGLLATRRKNGWKVYDKGKFRKTLGMCLTSMNVGRNMFEIAFDLSFRRHGALLVFDPEGSVTGKINAESRLLASRKSHTGQALIAKSVREIQLGKTTPVSKKKILAELASIDGAVVFDRQRILAVGALIKTHPKVKGEFGARSTAALSAYHWGGHPVKVSSDGDVTVYFKSDDEYEARIEFL